MSELTKGYSEPVAQLITLGETGTDDTWLNYEERGITTEHIPELIRILDDIKSFWPEEGGEADEDFAPIHAWRALGQMRAEEAIDPLINLLVKNEEFFSDWIGEEVPRVLGTIGPICIPALQAYLMSPEKKVWAAVSAGYGLAEVAKQNPESREDCVSVLQAGLEDFENNDETINGFLITYLAELKAEESAPLVKRAFQSNRVDESVMGDYEDFQVAVGLLEERLTPRPRYQWMKEPQVVQNAEWEAEQEARRRERQQEKKEKRKRKQAKTARRRKRKKR